MDVNDWLLAEVERLQGVIRGLVSEAAGEGAERSMTGKFVKKPVVVEAWQLTQESFWDVYSWIRENGGTAYIEGQYMEIKIKTLEGPITARYGDWIIRGIAGEFYPCKPDIFAATYEPKL